MKVKQYILILAILLQISYSANCQIHPEINHDLFTAEQIYRSKVNLTEGVKFYRSAFQSRCIDASKILNAIECAASCNDAEACSDFMEKGMQIGLTSKTYREFWKRYTTDLAYAQIIQKVDSITTIKRYRKSLNDSLIQKMKILAERDQKYRASDDDFDWELQLALDNQNWKELKALVSKSNRLPYYSELGMEGSDDLETIFYHMDLEVIEWFLPYVLDGIRRKESNLADVILYQLDRVGMDLGKIYTITANAEILELGDRTILENGYPCQTFGEWFYERSREDNRLYFTPIDPGIPIDEVNRVRKLFLLDSIESKWKRTPWVNVVSAEVFAEKIKE